ncbi:MAG: hypothetical protein MJE77_08485 [Proteobacteria bacterium]|nr:hypothetical protein [Pseudomonadota bacterium]
MLELVGHLGRAPARAFAVLAARLDHRATDGSMDVVEHLFDVFRRRMSRPQAF